MGQNQQNVSPMSNSLRNKYVINHLTDALISLLEEKPVNEISISGLCKKAGVGRASFYRNFQSMEDILKLYINQIFKEWTEDGKISFNPLSGLVMEIFTHFERHQDFYSLLNKRGLIYLLKDVIINIFGPKPGQTKTEAYATAFVSYSLYGWIEVWFQRGMEESAEEMAEMFKNQGL